LKIQAKVDIVPVDAFARVFLLLEDEHVVVEELRMGDRRKLHVGPLEKYP
jgi:hypothetical protein